MRTVRHWLRLFVAILALVTLAVSCGGRASSPASDLDEVDASLDGSLVPRAQAAEALGTPAALRAAILRTQQTAPGYSFVANAGGALESHAGVLGASVGVVATTRGVRLSRLPTVGEPLDVGMATSAIGRSDGTLGSRDVLARAADGQELVLTRADAIEERFLAGPRGVEHSYSLQTRPRGEGSLLIGVAFYGLSPELVTGTADRVRLRDAQGRTLLWYTDLSAVDAKGRSLDARMNVTEGSVALVIDDTDAVYPVHVDPLVWAQQQELTSSANGATDGAAGDLFGSSVAMSGSLAIVGAPNHASNAKAGSGAAYIYLLSAGTWTLQKELSASDGAAGDAFGTSVAISGALAIVGAPNHTEGLNTGAGSAYIYAQSGTTWSLQKEVAAGDNGTNDSFGTSVAISGTLALIGAPNHAVDPSGDAAATKGEAGAAYVFAQSGSSWSQQQELTASDAAAFDLFGYSVSLSGTTALVGAYQHDQGTSVSPVTSAGAAYVFVQSGSTWSQQQELSASDGAISDFFGFSVSVSGTTAVIGAYQHDQGSTKVSAGAAYVFVQSGSTWSQLLPELSASDDTAGDLFGYSVAVNAGTVVVGAPQHATGGNALSGAAYVFTQSGSTWTQITPDVSASDDAASDLFGTFVAASGDSVIIGAPQHTVSAKAEQGVAYVFLGGITSSSGCYISGTLYASGAANPADTCQFCTPGTSTTAWTTASDGTSCTDPDLCDLSTTCKSGTCTAGSQVTCTATDTCHTAGTCDTSTGVCSTETLNSGYCYIGGACVASGATNGTNTCETCQPGVSTTGYSAVSNGTSCTDPNKCDLTTTCESGACTAASHVTCTATDACHTAGTCNTSTGVCSAETLDANTCFIAGVCVASGASNGTNTCETCQPAVSTSGYSNVSNGTSCTDTNLCDLTTTCQSGSCTAGSHVTCTAPDACHTAGTCNTSTGVCSAPTLNAGFCDIGGVCVAAGAPNGANTCETCQPAVSTTGYSNVSNGTSCTDSNLCDLSTTCQAGACTAASHVSCTAPDACHTAGTCNTSTGVCSAPTLNAGFCDIGGVCVAAGAPNGANTCETCQPAVSTTGYSNVSNGTSCTDSNLCDLSTTCQAGACTAGSHVTCTAPDACHTAGTCNTSTGVCSAPTLNAGFCDIGGVCVAAGAPNGANTCETCQPAVSTTGYSNVSNGTSCTDSNLCDLTTTCQAGACTAASHVSCTAPDACHTAGTCNTSTGVCSAPTLNAGFCDIGGVCVAAGAPNGANTCETCQPAVSTTGYSNVSNGTSCTDSNLCDLSTTCQAGACTAASHVSCTAPDACHTAGTCNTSTGVCSAPTLNAGFCDIGGVCVAAGATNGANTCATCQPAVSTSVYSSVTNGTSCNDGNACDLNDTCQSGACTAGSHVSCTAPDACHTAGTCDTTSGKCSAPVLEAGFCDISGACVAAGAANGANLCETCQPGVSTSSYASVTNGTPCNDGVSCTSSDVCTNGTCGGSAYTCTPGVCETASTCNGNGGCNITLAANGTPCGSGDVCLAGSCVPVATDAGSSTDAGSGTDAGTKSEDGGASSDGGGGSTDGGSSTDASAATDSGSGVDSGGASTDAGASDASTGNEDGGVTNQDAGADSGGSTGEDSGVTDDDGGVSSDDGGVSEEDGGMVSSDAGGFTVDGGLSEDGGSVLADGGSSGGPTGGTGESSGCGCTTVGRSTEESPSLLLGFVGLGIAVVRRRRRGAGVDAR